LALAVTEELMETEANAALTPGNWRKLPSTCSLLFRPGCIQVLTSPLPQFPYREEQNLPPLQNPPTSVGRTALPTTSVLSLARPTWLPSVRGWRHGRAAGVGGWSKATASRNAAQKEKPGMVQQEHSIQLGHWTGERKSGRLTRRWEIQRPRASRDGRNTQMCIA